MAHDDCQCAGSLRSATGPLRRFPLLVDGERNVAESSIIVEHLQLAHPGPAWISRWQTAPAFPRIDAERA